jgi:hypothetical protein
VVKILHSYQRFPLPYRNQNLIGRKELLTFAIHYTSSSRFIAIAYS